MKDTPAFLLSFASALFLICPGVALLELNLEPAWTGLGGGLLVLGIGSWLYWTVRNFRDWQREFAPRRKRGKFHKARQ